jgi:hypothetical protein
LLIYLNKEENCYGGTAFYKHIATNEIRAKNTRKGFQLLEKELAYNNRTAYISDSDEKWELIKMIPMKKNRAILYSGLIFHSAYIKSLPKFNEEGRHTLNIFFEDPSTFFESVSTLGNRH